jgi:hypothetical protein
MSLKARQAGLLVLAITLDATFIFSSAFSQLVSDQKAAREAGTSSSAQGARQPVGQKAHQQMKQRQHPLAIPVCLHLYLVEVMRGETL